jgi:predicted membrane metal-binding protein
MINLTATQTMAVMAEDVNHYTAEDIGRILTESRAAARAAVTKFLADWRSKTGGNQYGEPVYCGFASTKIYGVRGNTRLGRAFKSAGIDKDYSGAHSIGNPSEHLGQSMDVKEQGARACAAVWRQYGFRSHVESRAD